MEVAHDGELLEAYEEGMLPEPEEADLLRRAFVMQERLQRAIYGEAYNVSSTTVRTAETMLAAWLTELMVEAAEGIRAVRYRPAWDRHQTDFDKVRGEVVDVFHYVISVALMLWDRDPDAFFAAYTEKWQRNWERARERQAGVPR